MTELTQEYLQELRTRPEELHCQMTYSLGKQRCALAVAHEVYGYNFSLKTSCEGMITRRMLIEYLGLPSSMSEAIIGWNDNDWFSFAEIADKIEACIEHGAMR